MSDDNISVSSHSLASSFISRNKKSSRMPKEVRTNGVSANGKKPSSSDASSESPWWQDRCAKAMFRTVLYCPINFVVFHSSKTKSLIKCRRKFARTAFPATARNSAHPTQPMETANRRGGKTGVTAIFRAVLYGFYCSSKLNLLSFISRNKKSHQMTKQVRANCVSVNGKKQSSSDTANGNSKSPW